MTADEKNEDAEISERYSPFVADIDLGTPNSAIAVDQETRAGSAASTAQLDALAAEMQIAERTGLEKDWKDLSGCLDIQQLWASRIEVVKQGLSASAKTIGDALSECLKNYSLLPAGIQEKLRGRQEGLDLIGRMASRLPDRLPVATEVAKAPLAQVGVEGWQNLVAGETDEVAARKKAQAKLNLLETERYQAIVLARAAGEKDRKALLGFLEKQVLPVVDAIDDGRQHSKSMMDQLRGCSHEMADILGAWIQVYDRLRDILFGILAQVQVWPMRVALGESTDYSRHEPFDVEPDPQLSNEAVKSVVRNGYEYSAGGDPGAPRWVLRPAQVIVVKNEE